MLAITCQHALAEMFDVTMNKNLWSKVDAVLHTRNCITNLNVRHDGTDERDPYLNISRTSSPKTTTAPPS
jgi:hypothetical protein